MSAGPALLPRPLFGEASPNSLFGSNSLFDPGLALVPASLLAAWLTPAAPAFLAPDAQAAPPHADAGSAAPGDAPPLPPAPPNIPPAITTPAITTLAPATQLSPLPGLTSLGAADKAVAGAVARSQSGATGKGVVIGILSDSFNRTGGYAGDVAQGLLAPGATVLKEGPSGSDEGRAMAQLIHQIAPDARILFYSGFGGQADFAHGIDTLAAAGASIIVDDVTYLAEPFYQDGAPIQAAVARAVAGGVSYFTSASNQGGNFYESAFRPLTTTLPGLSGGFVAANFGTSLAPSAMLDLTIAAGATATLDLQWDAPFASIGGSGGATTSLGMVLYDQSGRIVAYALGNQIGGDPVEILQFRNTTASSGFRLAIITDGGRATPGQFKFIAYGQGTTINDPRAGIGSGSIIGHEMVPEANTVGAIAWSDTAAFRGSGAVEGFSSRGPGLFLYNAAGQRLATPLAGAGVDYVAPDGSATSVFNPFYGTSAAAPNAAAIAALMLQVAPTLTPAQVSAILASTTVAASGPAGATGAGLVSAQAALKLAAAMAGPAGPAIESRIAGITSAPSGVAASSTAIGNAATVIASAWDALPDTLPTLGASPFTASLDHASGLVLAGADSLAGAGFGSLALLHLFDPAAGSLYDPVFQIS